MRDIASQIFFQQSGVVIESPREELLRQVREAALESRDELSPVDLELLAKALEYRRECILVTDDYAIQNLARRLEIQVKNITQPRIRRVVTWEWECQGCRRRYTAGGDCPVCGSPLKRRWKKE